MYIEIVLNKSINQLIINRIHYIKIKIGKFKNLIENNLISLLTKLTIN